MVMPFVDGFGDKPLGANFYPQDMTMDEFDELEDESKTSLYTLIRKMMKVLFKQCGIMKRLPSRLTQQPSY